MRKLLMCCLVIGLHTAPAIAQSAMPACDGDIAIIRVSTIKPGGMSGFLKAMEAHKAWYRSHGFMNNELYGAKVIVQDPTTKAPKYSDTEMMTFHVRPPSDAKPDAAWDAYVKQYRDSSDIKSEYRVCMPKTR